MDKTLLDEQIRTRRIVTSPSSFSVNKIRDNRAFRKSINNSEVKTHKAAMQLFTVKTESKVCFKISEAYIIEKKKKNYPSLRRQLQFPREM